MGNNSVPKLIFRLFRLPVYRGSVLGRFYCIIPHSYADVFQVCSLQTCEDGDHQITCGSGGGGVHVIRSVVTEMTVRHMYLYTLSEASKINADCQVTKGEEQCSAIR